MASIEIVGSVFAIKLTYELTQDVALNMSVMEITGVQMRSVLESWSNESCRVVGFININGSTAVKLEYTANASTGILMSKEYSSVGGAVSKYSVSVSHEEDGSGPISVYANVGVYSNYSSVELERIIKTQSEALPRIARASVLEAVGVELGQTMTITIARAASGITDTVVWICGSQAGTISSKTTETQLQWVPPISLASNAPADTNVKVQLMVNSVLGDTSVGSGSIYVYCPIPESVVPTLAVTVEDQMGYPAQYGGYVQNQSQARVLTQAAGAYGSTITRTTVQCGQFTGTGADVRFVPSQSGSIPITVTVTDSRGRSASVETAITVLAYRKPQVTISEAFRCDATGEPQPDGTWLKVVFSGSVTALSVNSAVYRGICTIHNGTEKRTVLLTDYTGQKTVINGSFLLAAGIDTGYDCQVSVQDDFTTTTSMAMLVSVAFALMDFCRDTKAVGIGMRAQSPGKLNIGLDTDMNARTIGNLADPVEDQDAATKAYVDGLKTIVPISGRFIEAHVDTSASGNVCSGVKVQNLVVLTVQAAIRSDFASTRLLIALDLPYAYVHTKWIARIQDSTDFFQLEINTNGVLYADINGLEAAGKTIQATAVYITSE